MASDSFIDFAAIRRKVNLEQVLAYYKVLPTLSGGGAQRKGPDPFGAATPGKSKPFSVNLEKNVWTLFRGDHPESGSVLDFVMRKERCGVRQAALKIADWFSLGADGNPAKGDSPADDAASSMPPSGERKGNPPLAFQLKGLDPHDASLTPLLEELGLNASTLKAFGAGLYTGNGKSMKGRLAAPIDRAGECVGYCGIDIDPQAPEAFKFPERWVHGVEIYNLTAVLKQAEEMAHQDEHPTINVFRHISQVWQSFQLGYPWGLPIAVMGERLTVDQLALLNEFKVLHRFPVSFYLDRDTHFV